MDHLERFAGFQRGNIVLVYMEGRGSKGFPIMRLNIMEGPVWSHCINPSKKDSDGYSRLEAGSS